MLNPISPAGVQGVSHSAPVGFVDVPFRYVYNVTLTAGQLLNGEVVSIFTEADFAWQGLIFSSTGTFSVQFQDGRGYYISSGMVYSTNMPNTPGDPWPIFPEVLYPAGGRIYLNIQDTSDSENTLQLLFFGVNRYAVR